MHIQFFFKVLFTVLFYYYSRWRLCRHSDHTVPPDITAFSLYLHITMFVSSNRYLTGFDLYSEFLRVQHLEKQHHKQVCNVSVFHILNSTINTMYDLTKKQDRVRQGFIRYILNSSSNFMYDPTEKQDKVAGLYPM